MKPYRYELVSFCRRWSDGGTLYANDSMEAERMAREIARHMRMKVTGVYRDFGCWKGEGQSDCEGDQDASI
jgi:hypothetical protein